ncbi:uncharacterized protein [Ptychodera flava]|uniref:uncharacterized protein n=1 Tax=Ptychodera flava TaxID=63121 RepID=UPI003969C963
MTEHGRVHNVYQSDIGDLNNVYDNIPSDPETPKFHQENRETEKQRQHLQTAVVYDNAGFEPPPPYTDVLSSDINQTVMYDVPGAPKLPPDQQFTIVETSNETATPSAPPAKGKATNGDIIGLVLAILACILFFPLGIPAIVLSCLAIRHRRNLRNETAGRYTNISIILSIIAICLFVTLVIALAATNQSGGEYGDVTTEPGSDSDSNESTTKADNSRPFDRSDDIDNGDLNHVTDEDGNNAHEIVDYDLRVDDQS